jgi:hypothetical protein
MNLLQILTLFLNASNADGFHHQICHALKESFSLVVPNHPSPLLFGNIFTAFIVAINISNVF